MDTLLQKLGKGGRNKLNLDSDQSTEITRTGRDRILSSTGSVSDYDNYDDDGIKVGEGEKKKMNVSIDITKALVIMGFGNWSELEPGNNS